MEWLYHTPYNAPASRKIYWYNGLLKMKQNNGWWDLQTLGDTDPCWEMGWASSNRWWANMLCICFSWVLFPTLSPFIISLHPSSQFTYFGLVTTYLAVFLQRAIDVWCTESLFWLYSDFQFMHTCLTFASLCLFVNCHDWVSWYWFVSSLTWFLSTYLHSINQNDLGIRWLGVSAD